MAQHRFADQRLEVTVTSHENHLTCQVQDRQTGRLWGPVPLLRLHVNTRGLQRTEVFDTYRVDQVEPLDDGIHVTVGRSDHRLAVGLWLRLVDGELAVRLNPAEIYEWMADYWLLFQVDVLPGLMNVGADGKLLLPLGEGVLSSPADKPAVQDAFLLYLEQSRWELCPTLPICGVQDARGGLLALARQAAADTQCVVATDGEGRGQCGMNFSLRRYWPDPLDFQRRELRLCPIVGHDDQGLVMAAAQRLRRHVVEDHAKRPLTERVQEDPGLAYWLDAYTMKLFHGIENEGPMCEAFDKSEPLTFRNCLTFQEAGEGLRKLREAGIEKIHTQSVGWNARGHDGLYPTRFPIEERVGGEEGFRELVRLGHELGYQMHVHDNFTMNIPHAPDFDPEYLIHDLHGHPLVSGWWAGGVEYQTWGLALPQDRFDRHFAALKNFGIHGPHYVDYMLRPLEVNYHPKHKGPRSHSEAGQVRIFEEARKAFGSVATEFAAFPAAVACDYITAIGHRTRGHDYAVGQLIDEDVPLWDLTFHGLTLRERGGHPTWSTVLQTIPFGRHPRDEWSARARPMPVLDDDRVARLAAVYELCIKGFGHLQTTEITHWQRRGEGLEELTYANGQAVAVNHQSQELFVDGQPITCPEVIREAS